MLVNERLCDICKKKITTGYKNTVKPYTNYYTISVMKAYRQTPINSIDWDICEDCYNKITKFIKDLRDELEKENKK